MNNETTETLLLTPGEVAHEIRLGVRKTRQLIRDGRIPSFAIDRARRVSRVALEAWVAEQQSRTCPGRLEPMAKL